MKKKTDYDVKILDIKTKFLTTSDYNKFTSEILNAKIKKELVDKSDISEFINDFDLDKKRATLPTRAELNGKQDKIMELQEFSLSYFHGKSHFKDSETL